jgi:hypothetical protein
MEVADVSSQSRIFREEIHQFVRASIGLLSCKSAATYQALSNEERGTVAYYLEELHHFLRREEAKADSSQRLIPF